LKGEITYQGENGSIKVLLNPDHCAKILSIVADAMVKTSQDIANNLTAEIINASPLLMDKSAEAHESGLRG
jgi:hypothetical protein